MEKRRKREVWEIKKKREGRRGRFARKAEMKNG